jgi:hypothetical protein
MTLPSLFHSSTCCKRLTVVFAGVCALQAQRNQCDRPGIQILAQRHAGEAAELKPILPRAQKAGA